MQQNDHGSDDQIPDVRTPTSPEALGLSLPGNGSMLATHADRKRLFEEAGRTIVELAKRHYERNDASVLPRAIATKAAFQNAMALDIAMGGSTNTVLHILAAAYEGGIDFDMDDIDALSRKVPVPDHVLDFVLDLIRATRPNEAGALDYVKQNIGWGAGPRASQQIVLASKVRAWLRLAERAQRLMALRDFAHEARHPITAIGAAAHGRGPGRARGGQRRAAHRRVAGR